MANSELTGDFKPYTKPRAQPKAEPVQEPQPIEDLTGVRVCCGEYNTCYRPCTPRGRWLAERESSPLRELSDGEVSRIWNEHIVPVFGKNGINPIVFARDLLQAARSAK